MSTIAFLGTGTMGLPMARNLAQAGFTVRAWNRSTDKAQPLADDGAAVCHSAAEAASGSTVLITMLSDADAVVDCATHALRSLESGAIWIQMSTIGVDGTDRCIQLAKQAGIEFVDAPVLGTRQPAEQGQLVVVASGPRETIDSCEQILGAVSSRVVRLRDAGEGTRCKVVVNGWLVALTTALAETIDLAEGLGIDPSTVLEAISGTAVDSKYAQMKGAMMVSGDFSEVSFKLALAYKDARLVVAEADREGLDSPIMRAVVDRFKRASEAGHDDDDMAALYLGKSSGAKTSAEAG